MEFASGPFLMSFLILSVIELLYLLLKDWESLPVSAQASIADVPVLTAKKPEQTENQRLFFRSIRELRSQGRLPPRNLERQAHVENHSQVHVREEEIRFPSILLGPCKQD